jgi:hypothetical protein
VNSIMTEELDRLSQAIDPTRHNLLDAARDVFLVSCLSRDWPQFFTNYAYDRYLMNADD